MPNEEDTNDNKKGYILSLPETLESIARTGGTAFSMGGKLYYCLSVIGQIEGHTLSDNTQKVTKYDHILPLLVRLESDDRIKGVLFLLNTLGGDVEAGLAIAEMIASMKTPTVSVVLGGGHSIGIPLAVSASRSFIVESATMTLHPVRTGGTVITSPQSFDYLINMQERILNFIATHSHATVDDLRRRMMRTDQLANDIGSVLAGKDAVECGLIDKVGGLADALLALTDNQ